MRKQNGITLIALVITIIILLILAAVSIAMLAGDNGILTRSREAQTTTIEKSNEEIVKMEKERFPRMFHLEMVLCYQL